MKNQLKYINWNKKKILKKKNRGNNYLINGMMISKNLNITSIEQRWEFSEYDPNARDIK